jgi:hypothetical protein
MDLNWLPARMMVAQKPRVADAPMTALKCLMMCLIFILSNLAAELNLMYFEIVIINGMPVNFMMSTNNSAPLYCCMIYRGIELFSHKS